MTECGVFIMITKKAYAKVNLSLDITGKRDDGYHLVRMVMQSIDIADILTFEKLEGAKIETLLVDKRGTDASTTDASEKPLDEEDGLGALPMGEDNLIYRAAELIMKENVWPRHPDAGVKITLEKNIPIAAGMAGGSSDAAATFKGINELFETGLMDEDLMKMGVTLGADIPYCIMGGTALSEGIGEKLTKLPDLPPCYILVAKPLVSVSTAEAYGGYDGLAESFETEETISGAKVIKQFINGETGKRYVVSGGNLYEKPDIDAQVDAVYSGGLDNVAFYMANVLEYVTSAKHPEIERLEKLMLDGGAIGAMMSGSGPTVYGLFREKDAAESVAAAIGETGITEQIFVTTPV